MEFIILRNVESRLRKVKEAELEKVKKALPAVDSTDIVLGKLGSAIQKLYVLKKKTREAYLVDFLDALLTAELERAFKHQLLKKVHKEQRETKIKKDWTVVLEYFDPGT